MDDIPWGLIIIVLIIVFGKKLRAGEWLEALSNSNKHQKAVFSLWVIASLFSGMYFGFQEAYGDFMSGIISGSLYSLIVGVLLFLPMIILLVIWREK